MSDLSITLEALQQSCSQLPVSSYFDAELFKLEQDLIFDDAPRYLGHNPLGALSVLALLGVLLTLM